MVRRHFSIYGTRQVEQKAPSTPDSTTGLYGFDNRMVSTCADKSTTGATKTLTTDLAGMPTIGLMYLRGSPRSQKAPANFQPLVAKMAWEGVAGYTGHVPGKDVENIHGLSVQHSKEQGLAEHTALRQGATCHPPWHSWATSNGLYPGYKPSWRTPRNTLDKVTKPHRVYTEDFHGIGIGEPLAESGKYQRPAAGCMGRMFAKSHPTAASYDAKASPKASRRGLFGTS
mmetsp:Transcript_106853/g.196266  ORF Transcript_106853/g.196266 Transcript_106853/m.196266 type:complete len:228 (+) Transcript_106853:47-730(+)